MHFTDGNRHQPAGDMWNIVWKVQRFSLVCLLLTLQAEVRTSVPSVSIGDGGFNSGPPLEGVTFQLQLNRVLDIADASCDFATSKFALLFSEINEFSNLLSLK